MHSLTLAFSSGTLELRGAAKDLPDIPPQCRWDDRTASHRAPAAAYADIVRALVGRKIAYLDEARAYTELTSGARIHHQARPYQQEAIDAWRRARGRGVVVLPTGAGKTHVATLAIEAKRRSTLVVAPTLDLVRQWHDHLHAVFDTPIGIIGGGEHVVHPITVTTYDSAAIYMEHLGRRFGLIVFDECHHLPGPTYALAARFSLAPFRLGLTATPERADGKDEDLRELIGPIVYRKEIGELAGDYLAEYETEYVSVDLSPSERAEYASERKIYKDFLAQNYIRVGSPKGWSEFIMVSSRTDDGRRAMAAYRRQRELAFASPAKLDYVEHLLLRHRIDRTILFTQDNATAYTIARRFLVPVISHQTRVSERSEILGRFSSGSYTAIATSKVLNEGVDVPDANVAIVLSGSGSVREHVQRLGRILRKKGDKRAILYELVSHDTAEGFTSERRREHDAYR